MPPTEPPLPDGWEEEPYDPENDQAPEGDPEHDCDGDDHEPYPEQPGDFKLIEGGAGTSADRGWGPGWPHCQYSKWVTLVRSDGVRLSVHREIKVLVAFLCDETERLGYNLVPGWCWGSACRAIRGSSRASNHSWGLALDLNAPENPMGPRNGKIRKHPKVITVWERYGFRWGGRYQGRADDMHFEFMGTPADAKELTAKISPNGPDEEDDLAQVPQKEWDEYKTKVNDIAKKVEEIWRDHGDMQTGDGKKVYKGVLEDVPGGLGAFIRSEIDRAIKTLQTG